MEKWWVFTIKLEGYALFSHKTPICVPDSEGFCEKTLSFGSLFWWYPSDFEIELADSNEERYKYNPSLLFLIWLDWLYPAVITTLYTFQRIGDGKYGKMGVAHSQMGFLKLFVRCVFNPHKISLSFYWKKTANYLDTHITIYRISNDGSIPIIDASTN